MLKLTTAVLVGTFAFSSVALAKGHSQPDHPGKKGHIAAVSSKGFVQSIIAQGGTPEDFIGDDVVVRRATTIFGNNGKGNGGDPDALGEGGAALLPDHDPGVLGGAPDTSR